MNNETPDAGATTIPLADQIRCVEREIYMRKRVYPKWVETNRMTVERAATEIHTMGAVLMTLKSLIPASLLAITMLTTFPAMAWEQAQHQRQSQSQTANGGNGGTGGAGGSGGTGGRGGNGIGTGGSSNATATSGGSSISVTGLGNSYTDHGRAPDVFIPSVGGGGSDCPTVGFGAGGAGIGGGGGFGPSWISSDCNKRKVADLLSHLYGVSVARTFAEQNIAGVAEAVKATHAASPTIPAYCITGGGTLVRKLPECGEDRR